MLWPRKKAEPARMAECTRSVMTPYWKILANMGLYPKPEADMDALMEEAPYPCGKKFESSWYTVSGHYDCGEHW